MMHAEGYVSSNASEEVILTYTCADRQRRGGCYNPSPLKFEVTAGPKNKQQKLCVCPVAASQVIKSFGGLPSLACSAQVWLDIKRYGLGCGR